MSHKSMSPNGMDGLLRDIRQKVCDCAVLLPQDDPGRCCVAFPCLKLNWQPLTLELAGDRCMVSDGGQVPRRLLSEMTDSEARRRMELQFAAVAEQFGVEQSNSDCRITGPCSEVGDALSRLLQFLSRCDAALQPQAEGAARTRTQFVELLTQASGLPATRWLDPEPEVEPLPETFQPLRLRSEPPWHVLFIESDRDAHAALLLCRARELRPNADQVLAVYQNQLRISRKLVAELTDLVDRQFASIGDRPRIERFLRRLVPADMTGEHQPVSMPR